MLTRTAKRLLAVCAVLGSSLALAEDAAATTTKEGTGEAAIINNDEQKAFEDAKQAALRSAIEQAAGVRVEADTVTLNNQLVRDQILLNSSGYVKSFDVTSKKKDKGVYTVTVKAVVITESLEKDVRAARDLVKRMGRPSIVVLLNEQTLQMTSKGNAITTSDTLATVLTQSLKGDGWDVKDPAFAMGKVRVAAGATLAAAEAKEIGDLSKAAYILYGTATLRNAESEPWMMSTPVYEADGGSRSSQQVFPVSGEYDLSLFATESGEQVTKLSGKLTFPNVADPGQAAKKFVISYERSAFDIIQKRKMEITDPVRKAVLEHFRNQVVNGMPIAVKVSGLESFTTAQQFKKSFETMKGIKEAEQQGFDKGRATYRVTYLGTPAQLAEVVEAATFKKRKLAVTTVTANTLEITVGK